MCTFHTLARAVALTHGSLEVWREAALSVGRPGSVEVYSIYELHACRSLLPFAMARRRVAARVKEVPFQPAGHLSQQDYKARMQQCTQEHVAR